MPTVISVNRPEHGFLPGLGDDDHGQYILVNGTRAFTGDVNLGGFKVTNAAAPSGPNDYVTQAWVNSLIEGRRWKDSVRAATTGNIVLSGLQTLDGVALQADDRVLVKDQTDPAENGLYAAGSGAWARTADANTAAELRAAATWVEEGTANGNSAWVQTSDSITLGTTAVTWAQFDGGQIAAGSGLTRSGNTINVGQGTGLTVGADDVGVNTGFAFNWSGTHTFSNATAPIVLAKLGPSTTQQHALPAVASDTIALLAATQTLSNKAVILQDGSEIAPSLGFASVNDTGFWLDTGDLDMKFSAFGSHLWTFGQNGRLSSTQGAGFPAFEVGTVGSGSGLGGNATQADLYVGGSARLNVTASQVSVASGLSLRVQGTGVYLAPFGSAAAPSYAFETDTDTGLFRQGIDAMGLAAGAVELLRVRKPDSSVNPVLEMPAYTQTITAGLAESHGTRFNAPTITSATANNVVDAATVTIEGAPAAAGSATVTNPWSLRVKAGASKFGGDVVAAAIGPATTQQHALPAVAADTVALLSAAQTLANKTLTTPTIASFANANHTHQDAAGGGTLDAAAIATGTLSKTRLPAAIAYEDETNAFAQLCEFKDVELDDQDATPVADRRLRVVDGFVRAATTGQVEGRFISRLSLEEITNAEVSATAAIAYSKLSLTGSVVDGDIAATGITTRSKLPGALAYEDEANSFTQAQTINPGTTPGAALNLFIDQPGTAGTRDSHEITLRGTSFDTAGHNADWKTFVDMTSNAGASSLVIQSRIDAASFADRVKVTDAGAVEIAPGLTTGNQRVVFGDGADGIFFINNVANQIARWRKDGDGVRSFEIGNATDGTLARTILNIVCGDATNRGNVHLGVAAPAFTPIAGNPNEAGSTVLWASGTGTASGHLVLAASATGAQVKVKWQDQLLATFAHNGTAPTHGFFGVSPVTRPTAYTQTFATATKTHAARTAVALTDNSGGVASDTIGDTPATYDETYIANTIASLVDEINKLRADQENTAQVVNALIDDHQSLGLVQ